MSTLPNTSKARDHRGSPSEHTAATSVSSNTGSIRSTGCETKSRSTLSSSQTGLSKSCRSVSSNPLCLKSLTESRARLGLPELRLLMDVDLLRRKPTMAELGCRLTKIAYYTRRSHYSNGRRSQPPAHTHRVASLALIVTSREWSRTTSCSST